MPAPADPAALEALARRIADDAHAGQTDKLGEPYIGHVARVAGRLEDPLDRAVAWLHDVIEDTEWTAGSLLREADFMPYTDPPAFDVWRELVSDVCCLTHRVRTNEPRAAYYERVKTSPRAVRVKLADIDDNTDPARMAQLDDATRERLTEKYRKARVALGVEET